MRFPRNASFWLGLAAITLTVANVSGGEVQPRAGEVQPRTWSYTHEGVTYFAVGLRDEASANLGKIEVDHSVIVDTSASQSGEYRMRTLAAVRAFLGALPSGDRVRIWAVDSELKPLMKAAEAVQGSGVEKGLAELGRRIPLGASNLSVTLRKILSESVEGEAGDRQQTLVYFGDGISAAQSLDANDLRELIGQANARGTAIHAYLVGPRVDLQLSGILALQTGGDIQLDADTATELGFSGTSPQASGRALALATHSQASQGGRISGVDSSVTILGTNVPPVRSDRETIVLGRSDKLNFELAWEHRGSSDKVAIELNPRHEEAFLKAIYESSEKDAGLSVPFAGAELLQMARQSCQGQANTLATIAKGAIEAKQPGQARNALLALQKLAPEHPEISGLIQLVSRQKEAAPEPEASENSTPRPGSIIDAEEARRVVAAQQLTHEVSQAIDQARKTIRKDPDAALETIKVQLTTVLASTDINPEIKEQLRSKLTMVWGELASRRDVLISEQADAQRRLSVIESNRRLIDQNGLDEERMKQLIDRARSLMDEGFRGDANAFEEAEAVARSAMLMRPGMREPVAALFVAEAAGQLDKQFRLRDLRQDKFLETLHQVELSHVPFPDEPPVVYPPAEIWRQIYDERVVRKNWANFDLKKYSKREQEIRTALDRTLDFPFEVQDETLQAVMDQLKVRLNVDILPDKKALDEAGVSMDTPEYTLSVSNMKVRTLLKLLLEQHELTFIVEDEVLKITTAAAALKKRIIKVYYAGDLAFPIQVPQGGGGGGFGGGGGGGQFGGGGGGFGGGGGGFGGGGGGFGNILDMGAGENAPAVGNQANPRTPAGRSKPAVQKENADRLLKGLIGAAQPNLKKKPS